MKFTQFFALSTITSLCFMGCQQFSLPSQSNSSNVTQTIKPSTNNPIMTHLIAFEKIAKENAGNRATGTTGGLASAKYIIKQAEILNLKAQMVPFENRSKLAGQHIFIEVQGTSGDKNQVVMLGAHYDSVKQGPGINDNASGVAVLLDLMQHYSKQPPKNNVMFVFWDSEEDGITSKQYADQLSDQQLKGIKAYINVDMVGTKDPQALLLDVDKSSVDEMEAMLKQQGLESEEFTALIQSMRAVPTHAGDAQLETWLKDFLVEHKVETRDDTSVTMSSDTAGFVGKVPVASLIFFNEQLKGDVLEFAPCYHQNCDTIDLIDPKSLNLAKDAIQHLILKLDHAN